jgi:hypothetical protein
MWSRGLCIEGALAGHGEVGKSRTIASGVTAGFTGAIWGNTNNTALTLDNEAVGIAAAHAFERHDENAASLGCPVISREEGRCPSGQSGPIRREPQPGFGSLKGKKALVRAVGLEPTLLAERDFESGKIRHKPLIYMTYYQTHCANVLINVLIL